MERRSRSEDTILPIGATPRWYIFRRLPGTPVQFSEDITMDAKLGGHDIRVLDMNGDGKPDIVSKEWYTWKNNSNGGNAHIDILWNLTKTRSAASH